jgi:hypothetical protein
MIGLLNIIKPFFCGYKNSFVTSSFLNSMLHINIYREKNVRHRDRSGLQNAGSGQAWALHCRFGLFVGLGAYLVKLGLGLGFYYIRKILRPTLARAWARSGPSLAVISFTLEICHTQTNSYIKGKCKFKLLSSLV